ncbi:RNA polymerase sigma factor [Micromonospora sp. NPDC004336]
MTTVDIGTMTDAEVIERSVREPESFAGIFDRHAPHIHRYLARRLGAGIADDLAAETFLVAFRRRERYDTAYPDARPWLYGIATNLVSQHRREEEREYRLRQACVPTTSEASHGRRQGRSDRLTSRTTRAGRPGAARPGGPAAVLPHTTGGRSHASTSGTGVRGDDDPGRWRPAGPRRVRQIRQHLRSDRPRLRRAHRDCLAISDRWVLAVQTRYPDRRGLEYGASICADVAAQLVTPAAHRPVRP